MRVNSDRKSCALLLCGLPRGWGKAIGVNPDGKSCSHILQNGHCHRALLVVLAICCDLPTTVQSSVFSMRTAVLPRLALDL